MDKILESLRSTYANITEAGYIDKVGQGNSDEAFVRRYLKAALGKKFPGKVTDVIEPTHDEDHNLKIDGWIVENGGNKKSITIKSRLDPNSNKDIIFEYYINYRDKTPGRDLLSKADYLAIKFLNNRIVLIDRAVMKKMMEPFIKQFYDAMQFNPGIRRISDGTNPRDRSKDRNYSVVVVVTNDPEGNREKLMCYIDADKIPKVIDFTVKV
jgi:hypothetical protein